MSRLLAVMALVALASSGAIVGVAPVSAGPGTLGLGALSVTSWTVNQSGFPGTIAISNGTSPYSLFASSGLPTGMSAVVSGSSVSFTGTPTVTGVFSGGSVTVQDSAAASATQTFSITINAAPTLGALSVTSWTVNTPGFPGTIAISGGTSPYSLFASSGLPTGMSAVVSGSSVSFTGTPTAAGVFSGGSVTVHDSAGASATQTFSITINAAPAFTSAASTTFSVGQPGSFTVTASGFPTPSLTDPPLPAGVTFTDNGNGTATLAGTPAPGSQGTYLITITAQNSVATVTQSFLLTVIGAPAATPAATAIVVTPRFTG